MISGTSSEREQLQSVNGGFTSTSSSEDDVQADLSGPDCECTSWSDLLMLSLL